MELLEQPGGTVMVAEAPIWDKSNPGLIQSDHLLLGITPAAIEARAMRGASAQLGQLYGVVCPGVIHAAHLFKGLKRGMMVQGSCNAAANKLIATWAQPRDARAIGHRNDLGLEYMPAPPNVVFAVAISLNRMLSEFPQIYGWIEHWTWIAADPDAPGAPIEFKTRFDEHVWVA